MALTRLDGSRLMLDNGQHILIGAYQHSLALMRTVGIHPETALLRQPLALRYPDGTGLQLPNTRPPWDALWGIARALHTALSGEMRRNFISPDDQLNVKSHID